MVIRSTQTVYSVFFLIFAFLNAAGLLIMLHAEFLAFILLIVYVGAVAVLFLFVVMMLGETQTKTPLSRRYACAVGGVCLFLLTALGIMVVRWKTSSEALIFGFSPTVDMKNTEALGNLLYTHYLIPFQGVGLILLIAMIGAIVLTLRHRRKPLQLLSNEPMRLVDLRSSSMKEEAR